MEMGMENELNKSGSHWQSDIVTTYFVGYEKEQAQTRLRHRGGFLSTLFASWFPQDSVLVWISVQVLVKI